MLAALTIMCSFNAAIKYSYYVYCPWPLEKEEDANVTKLIARVLKPLVDATITYLTFMLAVGFTIIKLDVSLFEVKFVFGLTVTKWLFSQIFSTLG